LHCNRHRYYNPQTAQYLSPDPLVLKGGFTPQSYVHNPNGWIDPLGLAGCDVTKRIDNSVIGKPRTGSAYKLPDGQHGFNDIIDNYAGDAAKFDIPTKGPGGKVVRTSELRQIQGSNNGRAQHGCSKCCVVLSCPAVIAMNLLSISDNQGDSQY